VRNYLTAAMLIATAYFAFSPEAQARDVTCGDVKAILAQTPGVTPVDAEAGEYSYNLGGPITVMCVEGAAVDLIVGFDPDLGSEIWPNFGRLAKAVGVDSGQAIKAAQQCRHSAEARLGGALKGLYEGEPVQTQSLHVDCRLSKNVFSVGVFRPRAE
jgi:hypothetical protein